MNTAIASSVISSMIYAESQSLQDTYAGMISDHSITLNAVALLCDLNILLIQMHAQCRCMWQIHASGARLVVANQTN